MASIGQLVRAVADVSGMDEATVKLIARYVREAGLIAQQSTGGGAAQMTASDAASLLIAVNSSANAKDAAENVRKVGALIPDPGIEPIVADEEVQYIFSTVTSTGMFRNALAQLIKLYMPTEEGLSVLQYDADPPISIHVAFERPHLNVMVAVRRSDDPRTGAVRFYYEEQQSIENECDRVIESRFTHVTLRKIAAVIAA